VAGGVREKAVEMLTEEVEKRSGVTIRHVKRLADAGESAAIVMATRESAARAGIDVGGLPSDESGGKAMDGYALQVDRKMRKAPTILAIGNDSRGALFAVGRLLREMRYRKGKVEVPANLRLVTAPMYPLRGHQLGYRVRNNTYDNWDLKQFEQYIRALIVWGTNAIELIVLAVPDDVSARAAFRERAWKMNVALSRLIGEYGLEVHVWLPADDRVLPGTENKGLVSGQVPCPSTPEGREYMLDTRRRLFADMPNLDGVFMPSGDPGGCTCEKCRPWVKTLITLSEDMAEILAQTHPNGKIWLSNQKLGREENDYLYEYLERKRPAWLGGLVFGPSSEPLPAMRQQVSADYPIRFYPDITHSVRCQYPVVDWDLAYVFIEEREIINPHPVAERYIHNLLAPYTCGAITYSEGAHDDVNKVVWSALDWAPSADLRDVILGYGRYFIGEEYAEQFADGIFALERNWEGPLAGNESVEESLRLWQVMEAKAPRRLLSNWRFQLGLFRAYLDAYVQRRLLADTKAEKAAYAELRRGSEVSLDAALQRASAVLAKSRTLSAAPKLQEKLEALAEAIHANIGMKLSIKTGSAPGRTDVLDRLGLPLNNSEWLTSEMERLLHSPDPEEKRAGISRLLHWEDPGPGSFYDDLGNPGKQPHLVIEKPVREEPSRPRIPEFGFERLVLRGARLSTRRYASASVLRMRYESLDPQGRYLLRVNYPPHSPGVKVRLAANRSFELQPTTEMPQALTQRDFEIPPQATRSGRLELLWSAEGGKWVRVSEVWLIKQS